MGLVAAALLAPPVAAQEASADVLRRALVDADHAGAASILMPRAEAGDSVAAFGIGVLGIAEAIEELVAAMRRHGISAPRTGDLGMMLGIPTPPPTSPAGPVEPLDYETLRDILDGFAARLHGAREHLVVAGEGEDFTVPVNVLDIRLDVDGDGIASEAESIGAAIAALLGAPLPQAGKSKSGAAQMPELVIGLDRADAFWLAGYSLILASQADFLLAHDFEELFNTSLHRIFPEAGLPMQDYSRGGTLMLGPDSDAAIADIIAFVHTFNFPVIDAGRLADVRGNLKAVTGLSRRNWEAILAETDDDNELVPSPSQTSLVPELTVSEEVVAAWMATLDTVEEILDGELLLPHWRFRQGFDLRAYFETAERTDLVLLLTGYDALPFLRDGPVADPDSFREGLSVFGEDFPLFALWFN